MNECEYLNFLTESFKTKSTGHIPRFNRSKCTGCAECIEVCPVDAVSGVPKKRIIKIDKKECIKCGGCIDACKPKALI